MQCCDRLGAESVFINDMFKTLAGNKLSGKTRLLRDLLCDLLCPVLGRGATR